MRKRILPVRRDGRNWSTSRLLMLGALGGTGKGMYGASVGFVGFGIAVRGGVAYLRFGIF